VQIVSIVFDIILAAYVAWEVVRFIPRYRRLKQAITDGDTRARAHEYYQALVFEWVSALLAIVALGFSWGKLNPRSLALESAALMVPFSHGDFNRGMIGGVIFGIAIGFVGFVVARLKANRRGATSPEPRAAWWRKFIPDFSALIPVTAMERLLWAAVAISAGICEELVFRGWLLATLHGTIGLNGTALILVASGVFGLAHAYQGVTGVILTAFAGAFFCILYVATGSLLIPILLHAAVDVRFAFLPTLRTQKRQAVYA
jgi:uncharacterized protein